MKPLTILDTDMYKFSMGQAVLKKFPHARAKYRFVNRNPRQVITPAMAERIQERVYEYIDATLNDEEVNFLLGNCRYLQPWYVDWLQQFRLNPLHVKVYNSPTFSLEVEGPWCETIYWEVPLLAIITNQIMEAQPASVDFQMQTDQAAQKLTALSNGLCSFAEFGTRRRYSYAVQDAVLRGLQGPNLVGTSNVHFAHKYGLRPIGTMAHEWIQAISGLVGLRHANKFALEAWNDVYNGDLGIALPDTFGSEAFFQDFDGMYSRLFDGVRHDSGDPLEFAKRTIEHYKAKRIDPTSKMIIFSDALNVAKCVEIKWQLTGKIGVSFGIGTHLTNDVPGTTPANIVIKLVEINDIPVVKLSDDPGKAIGDSKAIDVAKWTFGITT